MEADTQTYSDDNILIVKGRFKSVASNLYGQFFIIFNNERQFDNYNAIISTYSDVYNMEPHEGWEVYEERIADWKWKGNFNNSMTASILGEFKALAENDHTMGLLFESVYNYDYDNMDVIFYDAINRIIHDKNLILETSIQETTPEGFRQAREERAKERDHDTEQKEEPKDDGSVVIPIKAILAPVKGKPIYDLRVGDAIMVRIQPTTQKAAYYIKFFELETEDSVLPMPGKVVDIKFGSGKNDPIEILTELSPGVYGKITEEEQQVKLKTYDPSTEGTEGKGKGKKRTSGAMRASSKEPSTRSSMGRSTLVMIILLVMIIALFGLLIMVSW